MPITDRKSRSHMGRIYSKAQKEQLNEFADEILKYLESIRDEDNWRELLINKLEAVIEDERLSAKKVYEKHAWDFSKEKAQPVFASAGEITIRPFKNDDKPFYVSVHKQWNKNEPDGMCDILWRHAQEESSLFCVVECNGQPAGYVAIHDTRESIWELAIELDRAYCYRGIGQKSIMLFLRKVEEITLCSLFRARVEVDNLVCQKCMEKIGATLVRLAGGIFSNEEDCERFEQENRELIDDHILNLAEKLNVKPEKLLSHVLEYEIEL